MTCIRIFFAAKELRMGEEIAFLGDRSFRSALIFLYAAYGINIQLQTNLCHERNSPKRVSQRFACLQD